MKNLEFREIFSHTIHAKEHISSFSYSCTQTELRGDLSSTVHYLSQNGYKKKADEPRDRDNTPIPSGGNLTISTFEKGDSRVVIRHSVWSESERLRVCVMRMDEEEQDSLKSGIEKIFFGKSYPYENL